MSAGPERPIVLFEYDPTRAGDVPKRLLAGFTGALHTDGYSGYAPLARGAGHGSRLSGHGLRGGVKVGTGRAGSPQKSLRKRESGNICGSISRM